MGFFVNTSGGDWNIKVGGDVIQGDCIKIGKTEKTEEKIVDIDAELIDKEDLILGEIINNSTTTIIIE